MLGEPARGHADLPDQPELYGVRDTRARDGYAALLTREPWHWFATLTFRRDHERASGGIHPEKADKAFRFFIRALDEHLYGQQREVRRRDRQSIVWARGQEFHKDGKVHFHALLAAPDRDLNASESRYFWHEFWFREFGRNQIEVPQCQGDVVAYVSKYVTKDGEVDFSHNFGRARPPRLFEAEPSVWDQTQRTGNATRASEAERQGHPARVGLSLTPPVRPQKPLLNATHLYTQETDL